MNLLWQYLHTIYNIIRTNPNTMNNWKPINDFKKWAMYSSYYSIGFRCILQKNYLG